MLSLSSSPLWGEGPISLTDVADQLNRRSHFKYMAIDGEALDRYPEWKSEEAVAKISNLLAEGGERFPILNGMTLPMHYSNPVTHATSAIALRFPDKWTPGTPIIILVGDPAEYPPEAYPSATWVINLPVSNSDATTIRDYHRIREDCLMALPQIKTGRAILIGTGEGSSAALQMANRHPERFSAVAFSGAPSPAPLPNLDEKIIIHFCGRESYLDTMAGRAWIQNLNAQGNLQARAINGSVADAIQFLLDLEAQAMLPARGGE